MRARASCDRTSLRAVTLPGLSWWINWLADQGKPLGSAAPDLLARIVPKASDGPVASAPVANPAAAVRIQQGYGRLPMHFEPNRGKAADEVRDLARGAGYTLFLTDTEAVLVLRKGRVVGTSGGHEDAALAAVDSKLHPLFVNPTLTRPFSPWARIHSQIPFCR